MIKAIVAFEKGDKKACLTHIETISISLRKVMLNLFEKMTDAHVSRAVWVRHISGIHGWGLTLETDNPPIVYGGLSGSQILLFLAVDAFLGINCYHSDAQQKMQISRNIRDVAEAIRKYSFRKNLSERSADDVAIEKALQAMIKQLRVSELMSY
jgi:hypothetical protein